jgi:hypothetical protein
MERGRVYLWRVLVPLYRPMTFVVLNYSQRISGAEGTFRIDRDAYDNSAERMLPFVTENLEFLRARKSPSDFLEHILARNGGSEERLRFDLALTHYRVGNSAHAAQLLRDLDGELERRSDALASVLAPLVRRVIDEMEQNPLGLGPLLDEWERNNIRTFGLEPSLASGMRAVES